MILLFKKNNYGNLVKNSRRHRRSQSDGFTAKIFLGNRLHIDLDLQLC